MIIRKIPVYTVSTAKSEALTLESFKTTDFVINFPPLRNFTNREQVLIAAEGALTARMICRSLDITSPDGEMHSLRCENCFDANEKDEWILDISFTTLTKEGTKLTCPLRLPLSLPQVADGRVTLWFDGVWLRLLLDGELLNENAGVGDLCVPTAVSACEGITVAATKEVTRTYRTEEEDAPADFYFPHGFNTNVGDVMTFYRDGVYHIIYLIDRRHHGSRGGKGAHYLAHLTTRDLITWEEQEPVDEIINPYETFGTGTMFFHDGKYYMSYGLHTSRHPSGKFAEPVWDSTLNGFRHKTFAEAEAEGGMPMGATLAVSEDGIHFRRTELLYHGAQNPSVYSTADGGLVLYGGYGGEGIYTTDSIEKPFRKTDSKLVFSGPSTALNCTSECPAFFEMNGYKYLIVGFWGYFRTLRKGGEELVDAIKLGETVYEGLCVPMVAELPNGRRIMAGWIRSDLGWGAAMMQRELIQEEDGRLGMRHIPELYPEKQGAPLSCEADGSYALTERENYILECEAEADGDGIFALNICAEDGVTQLCIDTNKKRAQLTNAPEDGLLAEEIKTPYEQSLERQIKGRDDINLSDNYALSDIPVSRRFGLRILFRYAPKMHTTVCDIEIDGRRTMILARPNFFINGMKAVHGKLTKSEVCRIRH